MAKKSPKLFVLDTNVILHDSGCLTQFEDNDVAIPVAVLEELDHLQEGQRVHPFSRPGVPSPA